MRPVPLTRLLAAALLSFPGFALCATHVVKIEGMAFKPAALTVKRGDVVVWENADVVPHTVTEPGKFDSKTIAAGAKWSWKAVGTGRHDYVCTFHPGMKGTLVVGE